MSNDKSMHPGRRQLLATMVAAAAVSVLPKGAAQTGSNVSTLLKYSGADRERLLVEGARKEGVVSIYTSLNTQDSSPITNAFKKKYGLDVSLWRAGSEKVLQRAVTEARAGRFTCDILETNGPEMEALHREQVLAPFSSPYFSDLPEEAFPAHRGYVADRFNFFTLAYNTNLIKADEVPTKLEDLLQPRFAGKVAIEASDVDWFAAVCKKMGEEQGLAFFRKFAATRPQLRTGHTLLAQLLASGEVAITPTAYNHSVESMRIKGAPVQWKAITPTFGRPNSIGIARHVVHPHAALLFVDYVLSPEGQGLIKEHNRVPASTKVNSPLNAFKYELIDPGITLDEFDKWQKLWTQLFVNGH